MSQRSQIEWLKFGRLRNKRLMLRVPVTCTDQCEYYCFHILRSFFFRLTPSVVGPLRDNHHFLFPITKSDVCNKLEKVWPKGLGRVAKNHCYELTGTLLARLDITQQILERISFGVIHASEAVSPS
jgi:hypothetical protein